MNFVLTFPVWPRSSAVALPLLGSQTLERPSGEAESSFFPSREYSSDQMPSLLPVRVLVGFYGLVASHSLIVWSCEPEANTRWDTGSTESASTEFSWAARVSANEGGTYA